MSSYKYIYFLILLLSSCVSLERTIENSLDGLWVIEEITYNDYDIKLCYRSNTIIFKEDNVIESPKPNYQCIDHEFFSWERTNWKILESDTIPLIISLDTEDNFLNGPHELKFFKDEKNKLFKFKIQSDSLNLIATKSWFCYDCAKEARWMQKLVKLNADIDSIYSNEKQ